MLGSQCSRGQGVEKNEREAVKWYRKAAEQGNLEAANSVAWKLAVSSDPALRDGKDAVTWATKACEGTNYKASSKIDTLAAAFAAAGDFQQAIKFQKMALDQSDANAEAMARMQNRLNLYKQGLPFRE